MLLIVLFSGIPGSGKSTLSRQLAFKIQVGCLRDMLQSRKSVSVETVHFDDFYSMHSFTPELYKEGRTKALQKISELIQVHNSSSKNVQDTVIIVDDTMYYRSMRKKVVQIGKGFKACVIGVICKCSIAECLERNAKREEAKVSNEVITEMERNFQMPGNALWERRFFLIETSSVVGIERSTQQLVELVKFHANEFKSLQATELKSKRSADNSTKAYQLDTYSRIIMHEFIETAIQHGYDSNTPFGQQLNRKRREIIQQLVSLPDEWEKAKTVAKETLYKAFKEVLNG